MNNANGETIWKLLNYDTNDAWSPSKANLTKSQKGALIYKGTGDPTTFRMFFDPGMDSAWTVATTILRISPVTILPTTYVYGTQSILFEVYAHATLSMLSNYKSRSLLLCQQIIKVLNGADIEGIGRIYFDAKKSNSCRLTARNIGNATYKGYELVMCTQSLG
jgi:hypothetical protein